LAEEDASHAAFAEQAQDAIGTDLLRQRRDDCGSRRTCDAPAHGILGCLGSCEQAEHAFAYRGGDIVSIEDPCPFGRVEAGQPLVQVADSRVVRSGHLLSAARRQTRPNARSRSTVATETPTTSPTSAADKPPKYVSSIAFAVLPSSFAGTCRGACRSANFSVVSISVCSLSVTKFRPPPRLDESRRRAWSTSTGSMPRVARPWKC